MKLAPILSQYLITNKVLNLPGLGTFRADSAYDPDVDYSKKGTSTTHITFEQQRIEKLDDDLIAFVSAQTGKMKVLAESDLKSQLDAITNFLNTGKPYFISGIGTLTRKANGTIEFHKEKYQQIDKERRKNLPTEKNSVPQSYIDESRRPRKTKPAAIIAVLCLLAIAATVWFYIKNSENAASLEDSTARADSTVQAPTSQKPEAQSSQTASVSDQDSYKYVLEVANQSRASKRYNQLKTIKWPVEIETTDSINYTLFMKLPAAGADTTKVKDSLTALSGRKVWIER